MKKRVKEMRRRARQAQHQHAERKNDEELVGWVAEEQRRRTTKRHRQRPYRSRPLRDDTLSALDFYAVSEAGMHMAAAAAVAVVRGRLR